MTVCPESLIGVPHLMEVMRKGNVAVLNAPGNGIADDKGIYYFVLKMIRYYLGEEPILNSHARTLGTTINETVQAIGY